MDNVSGQGLLGVICCLYHPLWSTETDKKREKHRNWQRAADSKSRTSPHYSQTLLGVDQTGAISSLNFHYVLLPLNLCSSITRKDPHTSLVDMHMHSVPHPRPVGTHYLSRRVAPRVARSVSCHFAMLGSCKLVARQFGGRRQKSKATAGTRGLITTFGASRVASVGGWWLTCCHMLIVLEILENNMMLNLEQTSSPKRWTDVKLKPLQTTTT